MARLKVWNGSEWDIVGGVDADMLDGKHASAFALAGANGTYTIPKTSIAERSTVQFTIPTGLVKPIFGRLCYSQYLDINSQLQTAYGVVYFSRNVKTLINAWGISNFTHSHDYYGVSAQQGLIKDDRSYTGFAELLVYNYTGDELQWYKVYLAGGNIIIILKNKGATRSFEPITINWEVI